MKTSDLLLSSLNITEDEYNYKGLFILSCQNKSLNVDMSDLLDNSFIDKLRNLFNLDETDDEIRKSLMDMIMEKAAISSKITEGEKYEEKATRKKFERSANSLDMS